MYTPVAKWHKNLIKVAIATPKTMPQTPFLLKIPLNPNNASLCDGGKIEEIDTTYFNDIVDEIEKI